MAKRTVEEATGNLPSVAHSTIRCTIRPGTVVGPPGSWFGPSKSGFNQTGPVHHQTATIQPPVEVVVEVQSSHYLRGLVKYQTKVWWFFNKDLETNFFPTIAVRCIEPWVRCARPPKPTVDFSGKVGQRTIELVWYARPPSSSWSALCALGPVPHRTGLVRHKGQTLSCFFAKTSSHQIGWSCELLT